MVFIRTAVTVWKRRMDVSLLPSRYLDTAGKVFPLAAGLRRFQGARRLVAVTMLGLSSLAQAQTGSGTPGLQSPQREAAEQELMRQRERERSIRQQQEAAPDVRLPTTTVATPSMRLPSGEVPCFVIDGLELSGERSAEFQWALAAARRADDGQADPFAGRCLGTGGINLLMARVQNAIMQKG